MRCYFSCTADSYDLAGIHAALGGRYKSHLYRGVLHIEVPSHAEMGNVFCFPYGCIVCWGLTAEEEVQFSNEVKPFENKPLKSPVVDVFTYKKGNASKIVNGEIILSDLSTLSLMALSHALAQSVKLDIFESRIQRIYNLTKHIPEEMATKGRISLSKGEIRRKMGDIFLERNSINLNFDVLDTPEFFWEYPDYEPLYNMIANYLDIQNRVEVLNQRLGVVHELFEMLDNELKHQHSSRLEMTIIILIFIEIALTVLRDVLKYL